MNVTTHFRKVITITAEDSPNVKYARAQLEAGIEPTGEVIIPGVLPWHDFLHRLETWDDIRKAIGLYAMFYEGPQVLMFPPGWLDLSAQRARRLPPAYQRRAEAIGIDPGEGVDRTAMCAIDRFGILEMWAAPTKDTNAAYHIMKSFVMRHRVDPAKVCIDVGGGREHAHRMRAEGIRIRAVGFGESPTVQPTKGYKSSLRKVEDKEVRYEYRNRRSEMYGILRLLIDPSKGEEGFAIPAMYRDLRQQLCKMPLMYDAEGRVYLPSKNKKSPNSEERTLRDILGCSPDESDALVLATFALTSLKKKRRIGVLR